MREIFAGIQVRLASQRFPNKSLALIQEKELIIHVIERIQKINYPLQIALLCPLEEKDTFYKLIKKYNINISIFGGCAQNVLKRYYDAIEYFNIQDLIMRITGDNPLISMILAELLIKEHTNTNCNLSHFIKNPLGTGVEIFDINTLKKVYYNTKSVYDLEHVTSYIYKNPQLFKIHEPISVYQNNNISHLSIDYIRDIQSVTKLLQRNKDWDLDNII